MPLPIARALHALTFSQNPLPTDPAEAQFKNIVRYVALGLLSIVFLACAMYWLWHLIFLPSQPVNNLVSGIVGAGMGYALTLSGITSGVTITQQAAAPIAAPIAAAVKSAIAPDPPGENNKNANN